MKKTLRDRLIVAMFEAIYTKGYHASNLNEILKGLSASKGGMYHHFKSKKELTLCAINEVLDSAVTELWEKPLLEHENDNTIDTLCECISGYAVLTQTKEIAITVEYGCPLNNMIQELSSIDEDFAHALQNIHAKWLEIITHTLQRAQDNGECKTEFDVFNVALFIVSAIEGAISSAKVYNDINYYIKSTNELNIYIKAL